MVRSTFAVRETQSLGQQMLNAPFGIKLRVAKNCDNGQQIYGYQCPCFSISTIHNRGYLEHFFVIFVHFPVIGEQVYIYNYISVIDGEDYFILWVTCWIKKNSIYLCMKIWKLFSGFNICSIYRTDEPVMLNSWRRLFIEKIYIYIS